MVTKSNCSAMWLVLALAPLQKQFGLLTVMATTMQAVSGAGYPGVPSLDILGNVIPYIAKEEEKMEEETRRLRGQMNGPKVVSATFAMSAQCNRVAVEDGHTESVSIRLKSRAKPEEMIAAWNSFRAEPQKLQLPSAPTTPVVYFGAPDRPQARFAIDLGPGRTTAVGRLRPCGVLDWKFTVLSHNTIRGAAGAAVLNAELLTAKGYLGGIHTQTASRSAQGSHADDRDEIRRHFGRRREGPRPRFFHRARASDATTGGRGQRHVQGDRQPAHH